jgi:hypothetical protein
MIIFDGHLNKLLEIIFLPKSLFLPFRKNIKSRDANFILALTTFYFLFVCQVRRSREEARVSFVLLRRLRRARVHKRIHARTRVRGRCHFFKENLF